MVTLNTQAEELNSTIKTDSPTVYTLLSKKGKAIYFPSKGILAQGMAAGGKEINATLGVTYEDDGSPMILPSMARLINSGTKDAFLYAPSGGIKPLRNKWQELLKLKNPSLGNTGISLPVVVGGVTNGLSIVGYMFVDENDEIIVPGLYWENYDLVYSNGCGAEFKFFNFFKNKLFDIDSFKESLNTGHIGKRIVLLNFPNNPSGYTPTKEMGKEIIKILKETAEIGNKLVIILDDSYFGLNFEDDMFKESLFAQLASAHENLLAIKVDGITKEEYAWGFRVGFITYGIKNGSEQLYRALEGKTAGAIRGNISNASHISQSIFLNSLKSNTHDQEKERNKEKIRERYLKVKEVLRAHKEYEKYFTELPFNSGYFMCVRLNDSNSETVWQLLLDKYDTGLICYGDKGLFRIAFASTPADKIEKLFNNIYSACKDCASLGG
jgi:aspartate/methionine/tyrosine aminotransferase